MIQVMDIIVIKIIIQSVKSAKNTVQHHSSVKELGYKKVKYGRLYLLLDHVLLIIVYFFDTETVFKGYRKSYS